MDRPLNTEPHLAKATRQLAHKAFVTWENRLELLLVELQEERERILLSLWLSAGAAIVGLLAGITLTAAITVACWQWSPLAVLLILSALYGAATVALALRLARLRREWRSFSATCEELRKDRECLEKNLN